MEGQLTHAHFAPSVGQTYQMLPGSATPLEVVLVEAVLLPVRGRSRPAGTRAPFSLLFRGPLNPWLPQGTYPIEHATLGTLDLFLVPIGPDGEGMRYEAIFN